jgi:hypothetical protein
MSSFREAAPKFDRENILISLQVYALETYV